MRLATFFSFIDSVLFVLRFRSRRLSSWAKAAPSFLGYDNVILHVFFPHRPNRVRSTDITFHSFISLHTSSTCFISFLLPHLRHIFLPPISGEILKISKAKCLTTQRTEKSVDFQCCYESCRNIMSDEASPEAYFFNPICCCIRNMLSCSV